MTTKAGRAAYAIKVCVYVRVSMKMLKQYAGEVDALFAQVLYGL